MKYLILDTRGRVLQNDKHKVVKINYGELQKYVEFLRFFSRRRYMDDLSKREISWLWSGQNLHWYRWVTTQGRFASLISCLKTNRNFLADWTSCLSATGSQTSISLQTSDQSFKTTLCCDLPISARVLTASKSWYLAFWEIVQILTTRNKSQKF